VLLPLFLTFDNRSVVVDKKILEGLSFTTQQRPFYLKTIDLLALSQTQDDTRVEIGKLAISADFRLSAPQIQHWIRLKKLNTTPAIT
jgi:hypothetical protein